MDLDNAVFGMVLGFVLSHISILVSAYLGILPEDMVFRSMFQSLVWGAVIFFYIIYKSK